MFHAMILPAREYPQWAQILVLVPDKEDTELVKTIMTDAAKAAEEIGVSIIGGHQVFPDLSLP